MGHYDISTLDIDTIKEGRITNIVRSILLEDLANTFFFFLGNFFYFRHTAVTWYFSHFISVPAKCLNNIPVNGMAALFRFLYKSSSELVPVNFSDSLSTS
jgi:hypothetical protein